MDETEEDRGSGAACGAATGMALVAVPDQNLLRSHSLSPARMPSLRSTSDRAQSPPTVPPLYHQ